MKKLLIVLLLTLCLAMPACADFDFGFGQGKVKIYESVNTTATQQNSSVNTSFIVPGASRIIGVKVFKYNLLVASECYAILVDAQDGSADEVIDETEAVANNNAEAWFPYPLSVVTQLKIRQGSNSVVHVYYTN